MPDEDRIVAVGLLTERYLSVPGQGFRPAFPIEDHHEFDELLRRINAADRDKR